jgi:hypothetical protein
MTKTKEELLPCIITTDKRGVFMGYINPNHRIEKTVTAKNVRMVVYWSADVKGLFGLAANGPSKECRITAAAPWCVLHGVTAVLDITEKAEKAFKSEPWK